MFAAALLIACSGSFLLQDKPAPDYVSTTDKWRADYAKSLQEPEGWLSVAGLFWLREGTNTFGSDEDNAVRLPSRVCMPLSGTLTLSGEKVTLDVIPGVEVMVNDKRASKMELKSDM